MLALPLRNFPRMTLFVESCTSAEVVFEHAVAGADLATTTHLSHVDRPSCRVHFAFALAQVEHECASTRFRELASAESKKPPFAVMLGA